MIHRQASEPVYGVRTFYGPLDRATEYDDYNATIMDHPHDADLLVRYSRDGEYFDDEEMAVCVHNTQRLLDGLATYGVQHVNPHYIDESNSDGDARLMMVVDKVQLGHVSAMDVAAAKGYALMRLLEYTADIASYGGYIDPEIMHIEQFAFDGQNMVLVDIEPTSSGVFVDPTYDSMDFGDLPGYLLFTTARLVRDVIDLPMSVQNEMILQKAVKAIAALPGESDGTNAAKVVLLSSLDAGMMNIESVRLANGQAMDNSDDDEWMER